MGEWKDFNENYRTIHSPPFEEEKDPTPCEISRAVGLFEKNFYLSHEMET
jgi:hypothetical protein